jgi:hypothetical protein
VKKARIVLALVAGLALSAGAAHAQDPLPGLSAQALTPVAKVDNGLGSLPPLPDWREPWLHAMPAEKIDSGLGSLPPLSEWREPWLYAMPAEKIDSGLGALTAMPATPAIAHVGAVAR